MKKIDIVTFTNNSFFVRYASGKTATYTKKTLPQTVLNWILEPDTIPHDITTENGLICGTNYKKGVTK